jgi:hypothetical protein
MSDSSVKPTTPIESPYSMSTTRPPSCTIKTVVHLARYSRPSSDFYPQFNAAIRARIDSWYPANDTDAEQDDGQANEKAESNRRSLRDRGFPAGVRRATLFGTVAQGSFFDPAHR